MQLLGEISITSVEVDVVSPAVFYRERTAHCLYKFDCQIPDFDRYLIIIVLPKSYIVTKSSLIVVDICDV